MRYLLAAHEKEIPGLKLLGIPGWQVHIVGVGQFAALARLAALITTERPSGVLLVGTAGAIEAASVGQQFAVQHFAYPSIYGEDLPEFLDRAFTVEPAIFFVGFSPATVLQNHGVSTDVAKFLSNMGYIPPDYPKPIIENMEAASLAQLCRRWQIPFTALLAVTNTIGPHARSQWNENFRQAGDRLAKTLQLLLV